MSTENPLGVMPAAEPDAMPPGSTTRFNATDGSRRSADWRVWTVKNANDIYAAARIVAGEIKISLHETGSWQHGFTADGKAKDSLLPGQSRHFTIWQRPGEIVPGWTRAVRIIIPDAALQVRPSPGTQKKPVANILTLPVGDTTIAEIWLESPAAASPPPLMGSQLAGRLRQPDGGIVWVVEQRTTLPWDPHQRFSQEITATRSSALKLKPGWTGEPPMSTCVHDPSSTNPELILWELAVTR